MTPNICIAVPSGDMIHMDVAMALLHATHQLKAKGIEASLLNMRSARIADLRNKMTHKALEHPKKFTHIFWMDSDVLIPATLIERLLLLDKDIVGCTYRKRTQPHDFCHLEFLGADISLPFRKVEALPGGCMLVKREVYEDIDKGELASGGRVSQWYTENELGEDLAFCERARVCAGRDIWLDSGGSWAIRHLGVFAYGPETTITLPTTPTETIAHHGV